MSSVPERDWKLLSRLREGLLAVACERIFQQVDQLAAGREGREHERYLALWRLLATEDKRIVEMFDGLSRNSAFEKILLLRRYGVLGDEQFSQFSPETQKDVSRLV